jgi:hypothetical protein
VGYRHNCVPREAASPAIDPVACKPNVDNDADHGSRVDNITSKSSVINVTPSASARTNAQRQAKWRSANRDKHRERNRALMHQKRATERAGAVA